MSDLLTKFILKMKNSILIVGLAIVMTALFSCNSGEEGNKDNTKVDSTETEAVEEVKVEKTEDVSFEVAGKCQKCKDRIELAAAMVDGVQFAEWNMETKVLNIKVLEGTDVTKVKNAIVEAGHDVGEQKASDEIYNSLENCCKYRDK